MRIRQTSAVRLVLGDDGIIETTPIETNRSASVLSEIAAAIADVGRGGPRPILWDPTGTLPLPPEGWLVVVNNLEDVVSAVALVVAEEDLPLLGAFPEVIDSLLLPVRVFGTKEAGREWLIHHVDPTLSTDEVNTREDL